MFNGTYNKTGYIVPQEYEMCCVGPEDEINIQQNMKQYIKPKKISHKHSTWSLWRRSPRHD